ncbi:MAG: glycosyltransferase [Candidatus Sumerlaeia bacterium]|nr:glycosyltransferase [Candidatus Sumerlaeia bacterium]
MPQRPRVVHVYKDYWPPVVGGIERSIHWMANALADRYDITVLVNSRARVSRERLEGAIRIVEVAEWGRAFSAPLSPGFPAAMRRLEADLWHFHIPNPTGDVSWLLSRPKGRLVATYHSDVVRQRWAMAAYAPLLRAFLRRCDRIMPTSPRLIDASPFLAPLRDRCEPVPLGMPLEPFARTAETAARVREIKRAHKGMPLLCFVGRLRYYKGLQFAVAALPRLPKVQLLVIGDGPEREPLGRLAAELGVADRVHFLGTLSDEDVVAHLQAADLFVLPSHLPSEAYGLSQIEALACGTPVVCCDLPTGVPWVNQDGVTGRVVPKADPEALAKAVADLLGDQHRRFAMSEAAHRRARAEFDVAVMATRIDAVYRAVLAGG